MGVDFGVDRGWGVGGAELGVRSAKDFVIMWQCDSDTEALRIEQMWLDERRRNRWITRTSLVS